MPYYGGTDGADEMHPHPDEPIHDGMMGGAKKKTATKRKLSGYNKFVRACAKTQSGTTRSGKDMMTYCASQWKKLSASEKASYNK